MAKIYVVGMGPGGMEDMTPRASTAIQEADLVIGYQSYIDLIKDYFPQKEFLSTGMTQEVERCKLVLKKALEGYKVALVSSGDSGVYGMAGLMLEIVNGEKVDIALEVIPGITAASAAAAILGAPIMHDFAVISLSDLLTPWELILKRMECAGEGDFVVCIYNPKSKSRKNQIIEARNILLRHREGNTPVGIVRKAGRQDESSVITDLNHMLNHEIDMSSMVIVGNSKTYVEKGRMITPRGYIVKE